MAIRLNQHSPQSVIPSTVNQVSRPRTSGSGKELRRPLRKNPASGIFFVLCCLDRFCDSVQSDERDEPPCPSSGQSANNRDGCSRPKTLLRSAAFRGQHNRVCILPFSAIGGFTDIHPASIGVGGKKGTRHSPTVINSAYSSLQFGDGGATSLEEQAKGPIENPLEMATAHAVVVKRLPADPKDVALVKPAWGTEDILAFLDSLTAPLPDNLRPPAGLTTKQTAQNG